MLVISEHVKEAVAKTVATALEDDSFPDLMEKLNYLHTYGGNGRNDPSAYSRCHLRGNREGDLDFNMDRPRMRDDHKSRPAFSPSGERIWDHWFAGGLVYHDHSGEWGVHT